jgi:hypothetical protein
VRGTLTSEMWETTNGTWLKMRDFSPAKMLEAGRVISSSGSSIARTCRGVTIGTMLQDEALRFIRLGTFLERADNTARILEVKYLNLLPGSDEEMQSADYYQWSALLRSVSAFEVYRGSTATRSPASCRRAADPARRHAASLARCMKEVYSNLPVWPTPARPKPNDSPGSLSPICISGASSGFSRAACASISKTSATGSSTWAAGSPMTS